MKLKFPKTLQRVQLYSIFILLLLTSTNCGDDDNGPDPRDEFIGTYSVNEYIPGNATVYKTYEITISKSGNDLEIGNFPAFFVPWKATVNGYDLIIPDQTFTQGTLSVTVSGGGAFNDQDTDMLSFAYQVEGFGNYDRECTALKK